MKNSSNTQGPLYDIWLLISGRGRGPFEELGAASWQEAEDIAVSYRQTARCTGHTHFQYIVHQRGSPPPASQAVLDDLPFGDPRLVENGLTYTEQEILGEANEQQEGMWEEEEEEEEGLLAAFLRGKILHSVPQEEEEKEEPDELYRQTWPYRHDFVPPEPAEQEQQDAGGEEDDSLFFF